LIYIKEAERRWNRIQEYHLCEIPGPIKENPYWTTETEGNWMVCEAPDAIYCNKDPNCAISPDGSNSLLTKIYQEYVSQKNYNEL